MPTALRNLISIHEVLKNSKKECLKIVMDIAPDALTSHGEIHGGYISMLTMSISEVLASTLVHSDEALLVVEHSVHFLRHPETVSGIEIESCVLNRGERILNISSYVRCRDIDVVYALTTFVIEKNE